MNDRTITDIIVIYNRQQHNTVVFHNLISINATYLNYLIEENIQKLDSHPYENDGDHFSLKNKYTIMHIKVTLDTLTIEVDYATV